MYLRISVLKAVGEVTVLVCDPEFSEGLQNVTEFNKAGPIYLVKSGKES